jgi:hypothetical protein
MAHQKIELPIIGMICANCAITVERTLCQNFYLLQTSSANLSLGGIKIAVIPKKRFIL